MTLPITQGLPCQPEAVEQWLSAVAFQAMRETFWLTM
jgi:hypothetical protein